jgi:DNA polymerase III delta prime subunit
MWIPIRTLLVAAAVILGLYTLQHAAGIVHIVQGNMMLQTLLGGSLILWVNQGSALLVKYFLSLFMTSTEVTPDAAPVTYVMLRSFLKKRALASSPRVSIRELAQTELSWLERKQQKVREVESARAAMQCKREAVDARRPMLQMEPVLSTAPLFLDVNGTRVLLAGGEPANSITVTIMGSGRVEELKAVVEAMCCLAEEDGKKRIKETTSVYHLQSTPNGPVWGLTASNDPRHKDTLIYPPDRLESIIADAEKFFTSAEEYEAKGIPHRRGYLVHGPPGTGKTSLGAVLSAELGMPVFLLALNFQGLTDSTLVNLLHQTGMPSIILIEDVDCAGMDTSSRPGTGRHTHKPGGGGGGGGREGGGGGGGGGRGRGGRAGGAMLSGGLEPGLDMQGGGWEALDDEGGADGLGRGAGGNNQKRDLLDLFLSAGAAGAGGAGKGSVTFSGLLNAIDGVAAQQGRLLIMTTNHASRLDPALVRPGRCDLTIELQGVCRAQALRMFRLFFPDAGEDIAESFADALPEDVVPAANVIAHLRAATSAEGTLERAALRRMISAGYRLSGMCEVTWTMAVTSNLYDELWMRGMEHLFALYLREDVYAVRPGEQVQHPGDAMWDPLRAFTAVPDATAKCTRNLLHRLFMAFFPDATSSQVRAFVDLVCAFQDRTGLVMYLSRPRWVLSNVLDVEEAMEWTRNYMLVHERPACAHMDVSWPIATVVRMITKGATTDSKEVAALVRAGIAHYKDVKYDTVYANRNKGISDAVLQGLHDFYSGRLPLLARPTIAMYLHAAYNVSLPGCGVAARAVCAQTGLSSLLTTINLHDVVGSSLSFEDAVTKLTELNCVQPNPEGVDLGAGPEDGAGAGDVAGDAHPFPVRVLSHKAERKRANKERRAAAIAAAAAAAVTTAVPTAASEELADHLCFLRDNYGQDRGGDSDVGEAGLAALLA